MAGEISTCLANQITLPEEDHPIPFDGASDIPIDDQKGNCLIRIHSLLRGGKYEAGIILMRSAREVWPEDDCFGSLVSAPEDELMLLKEIFLANLPRVSEKHHSVDNEFIDENGADDYDDEEEEEDNQMTEIDFRFEDFAKRLLNPKVVHACTLVLSDWEQIPKTSLLAAVTILHRIAVGCKMPALLFQASLFRIFQRVFHAPKDDHQEELRRLGVYIVRQFTALASNNPKIYAELLFYKSIREANGIEMGYEDMYGNNIGSGGGVKGAWNEEQEEELRRLFMENQENPESDQDVIDWMLDNLIDKTRTRRGVIKKLKELGLIFKAPTKKSNAAASNKNLWTSDQDEKLKQLYDEHRSNENVLAIITEEFDRTRSKQGIVKRMISLGLIADKCEVKPPKNSRSKKTLVEGADPLSSGDISSDSDEDDTRNRQTKPSKRTLARRSQSTLNFKRLRTILSEIEESMKEAVEWLTESFAEASEDYEEDSEDPDDGVPLVPISSLQREALEHAQFKELLKELGVDAPTDNEAYWRIPVSMKPEDLQLRVGILNGKDLSAEEEPVEGEASQTLAVENVPHPSEDEDEPEVSEDIFNAWRNKANVLYSKSDDESEVREPLKRKSTKEIKKSASKPRGRTTKKKKSNLFDVNDLVKQSEGETDTMEPDEKLSDAELENLADFPRNRSLIVTSDEDDISNNRALVTSRKKKSKIIINSDSEPESDSEQVRLVVSDDEDGEERIYDGASEPTTGVKRGRSVDLELSDAEEEGVMKRTKHHRRVVISDNEDE